MVWTRFRERNHEFIIIETVKKVKINGVATIFSVMDGGVREKNVRIKMIKKIINAYVIGIWVIAIPEGMVSIKIPNEERIDIVIKEFLNIRNDVTNWAIMRYLDREKSQRGGAR